MAVGGILTSQVGSIFTDVLVLVAGVTWLLAKPGLGPVLLLACYQVTGLLFNGLALRDAEAGTAVDALFGSICLRLLALTLMCLAHVDAKRRGVAGAPQAVLATSNTTTPVGPCVDGDRSREMPHVPKHRPMQLRAVGYIVYGIGLSIIVGAFLLVWASATAAIVSSDMRSPLVAIAAGV